jgi:hypothetical protein
MSSIINNLQEKLVDVSDQIIRVMEEGTSIIMGLAQEDDGSNQTPPSGAEGTFNDQMDDIEISVDEEDLVGMKSPLDGITEGVLGDIMKNQVSSVPNECLRVQYGGHFLEFLDFCIRTTCSFYFWVHSFIFYSYSTIGNANDNN